MTNFSVNGERFTNFIELWMFLERSKQCDLRARVGGPFVWHFSFSISVKIQANLIIIVMCDLFSLSNRSFNNFDKYFQALEIGAIWKVDISFRIRSSNLRCGQFDKILVNTHQFHFSLCKTMTTRSVQTSRGQRLSSRGRALLHDPSRAPSSSSSSSSSNDFITWSQKSQSRVSFSVCFALFGTHVFELLSSPFLILEQFDEHSYADIKIEGHQFGCAPTVFCQSLVETFR